MIAWTYIVVLNTLPDVDLVLYNLSADKPSFKACGPCRRAMLVFFKIWPENIKKAFITLQDLRFNLTSLNQTCISSKSIIQLTKTIFSDSAIFIYETRVENRLWAKSEFLWAKKNAPWSIPR